MRKKLTIGITMFVTGISVLVLSYAINRSFVGVLIGILASVMWMTGGNLIAQAIDYLSKQKKDKHSSHLPSKEDNEFEEDPPF